MSPSRARKSVAGGDRMFRLNPKAIWRYLRTQPASFWLVCTYLFFEYVRPQSIYTAMNFLPWAFLTIVFCAVAFAMEGGQLKLDPLPDTWLVVFLMVVLASTATAVYPSESYKQIRLFLSWMLIYLLISNIVTQDRRFFVFILSYLLYNLKMSLHATRSWAQDGFVFRSWGATGAPGWFQNSGEFGIEMTMFVPISIAFILGTRRYWGRRLFLASLVFPVTALVGAVASSSRGALLGMAGVGLWFIAKSKQRIRVAIVAGVLGFLMYAITPAQQRERMDEMGSDTTSVTRLTYWKNGIEIGNQHPVLGIGYFNWLRYYRRHYDPDGLMPHNIFIQAFAELGYSGLVAFVILILVTIVINYRTRRALKQLFRRRHPRATFLFFMAHGLDGGLIGFLVSGFFVTVLYYPFFWINFALTVALNRSARRLVARSTSTGNPSARRRTEKVRRLGGRAPRLLQTNQLNFYHVSQLPKSSEG